MKREVKVRIGDLKPGDEFTYKFYGLGIVLKENSYTRKSIHLNSIPVVFLDYLAFDGLNRECRVTVEREVLTWPDLKVGELFRFGDPDESRVPCLRLEDGYRRLDNPTVFHGLRDLQIQRMKAVPCDE